MDKRSKSKTLFERSLNVIPGGVNSPARAFRAVEGTPVFMDSAKGSYLFDVDGNRYIDYIGSWGPMILGHCHPQVIHEVNKQIVKSSSFGAPTELEAAMAEQVISMVPGLETIRMVNSGTEACMSAIRLARGYTNRTKIIKFSGCYHGHYDSFLVKAGSGVMTAGLSSSSGVSDQTAADTIIAEYNNIQSVKEIFTHNIDQIAALIVEPVAGNMGCIPPDTGFLAGLADLCKENGSLFVLDEVMTGFRLAKGGATQLFDLDPDIICFGKIIGGGLPVGAFGGKKKIFESLAPLGPVYQAGTLSGNPLAMAAGLKTLQILDESPFIYENLNQNTKTLAAGLQHIFDQNEIQVQINQIGSMMSVFFTDLEVKDYQSAGESATQRFNDFFWGMLDEGVYLPPSKYESWFLSTEHAQTEIDYTLQAADKVIKSLD